jgi:mannosyltransferase
MAAMQVILDDIIYLLQRAGGISEYWRELSAGLSKLEGTSVYNVSPPKNATLSPLRHYYKYKKCITPPSFDGVFHSSYYRLPTNRRLSAVTVHDFIYHKFYKGPTRYFNCKHIGRSLRRADAIISISESTRDDLLYYHPELKDAPIFTIYHGVDHAAFYPNNSNLKEGLENCVVFVGGRFEYKNFHTAVRALSATSGLRLGVIGAPLQPHELEFMNSYGVDYIEFGYVSKTELASIYASAYCLLYPSLYEGFGMPILEAMACGLPVITSDHRAVTEVGGDCTLRGNGRDVESYVNALNLIDQRRMELKENGLAHAAKFSWKKCVGETAKVYSIIHD